MSGWYPKERGNMWRALGDVKQNTDEPHIFRPFGLKKRREKETAYDLEEVAMPTTGGHIEQNCVELSFCQIQDPTTRSFTKIVQHPNTR